MSIKQLNPYVHLNGTAAQAIQRYERVLGATVEHITHYREVPGLAANPAHADRVIHAALRIGPSALMVSDSPIEVPPANGAQVSVALDLDDPADAVARFDALAADGGKVVMPLHDTFYGARMGVLVDAFGVQWMFNINK